MNRELEYLKKAQGLKNELDNLDNPISSTPSLKGFAKELGGFLLVVLGILGAVASIGVFMVAKEDPTYLTSPLWYPIRLLGLLVILTFLAVIVLLPLFIVGVILTGGLQGKTFKEKSIEVSKRILTIAAILAVIAAVIGGLALLFITIGPWLFLILLIGALVLFIKDGGGRNAGRRGSGYHGGGGFSSGGGFGGGSSGGGGGGACGGGGG